MNSCLYKCNVFHYRMSPIKHSFNYKTFMFYLDLDELEIFSKTLWFFSWNKFNIYNFRDKDHLQFKGKSVKEKLKHYLKEQGLNDEIGKVMLLTNLATLGYNFNPVSFFFCYDKAGNPLCAVPEVGNTFRELKLFYLGKDKLQGETFSALQKKYFYVSPYTELDSSFYFRLNIPVEKLQISIDDYKNTEKFFISRLSGKKTMLNDLNLFLFTIQFPLITLKVIGSIHWQALKLYFKKLPYYKKNDNLELQRGVLKNARTYN